MVQVPGFCLSPKQRGRGARVLVWMRRLQLYLKLDRLWEASIVLQLVLELDCAGKDLESAYVSEED